MWTYEPGKGTERAFSLLQDTGLYKVMCSVGDDTIEAEFTGLLHETWEGAEREMHEAENHGAIQCTWIEMI